MNVTCMTTIAQKLEGRYGNIPVARSYNIYDLSYIFHTTAPRDKPGRYSLYRIRNEVYGTLSDLTEDL